MRAGEPEPVVVDVGGFRVGLMTCYDLRFPEMARLLVDAGAEVLVVPAAWVAGERKVEHWRTLARARAIENTAYVVAVGPARVRATPVSPWSSTPGRRAGRGRSRGRTLTASSPGTASTRRVVPTPACPIDGCSLPARVHPPRTRTTSRPAAAGPTERRRGAAAARSRWSAACVVLAGLVALVVAALGLAPEVASTAGAIAVSVAYVWALAVRTGGRPVVFGLLSLAIGVAVLLSDSEAAALRAPRCSRRRPASCWRC